MRFLLDENVSLACIEALRADGHDVVHVTTMGLAGASDSAVVERARSQERILVTRDHHFSNPVRFPPEGYCGIIYIRPGNLTSESEAALVRRVVSSLPPSSIVGHLVTVSRDRATVR